MTNIPLTASRQRANVSYTITKQIRPVGDYGTPRQGSLLISKHNRAVHQRFVAKAQALSLQIPLSVAQDVASWNYSMVNTQYEHYKSNQTDEATHTPRKYWDDWYVEGFVLHTDEIKSNVADDNYPRPLTFTPYGICCKDTTTRVSGMGAARVANVWGYDAVAGRTLFMVLKRHQNVPIEYNLYGEGDSYTTKRLAIDKASKFRPFQFSFVALDDPNDIFKYAKYVDPSGYTRYDAIIIRIGIVKTSSRFANSPAANKFDDIGPHANAELGMNDTIEIIAAIRTPLLSFF
jgi:hypothetical protein